MNWRRGHKGVSVPLVSVVIVMLVAALLGGFLSLFYWDYVRAAGNEPITRTFQPSSADTYVDEKNPDTNYGSSAVMDVGPKAGNVLHSLVQFDISSILIPTGATVNSANLSLYFSAAPTTSRLHGVHRVTSPWVEGTVTWTTAPSFNGTDTDNTSTGTAGGVWLTWDVTDDASAYIGGTATNYGWIVKDTVEGVAWTYEGSYATKEEVSSSLHPTMSITFTAPWESYSDVDHLVLSDNFTDFGDTVYMKGTGFAAGNYTMGYYDGEPVGGGDWVAAEDVVVGGSGNLTSQYYLPTDTERKGDSYWHVLVQPASGYASLPSTYDTAVTGAGPDTYGLLADDSFYVAQAAIPEFPTIMAAIMVVGLCFGIYYWMRKRRLAYVKA